MIRLELLKNFFAYIYSNRFFEYNIIINIIANIELIYIFIIWIIKWKKSNDF
jgi:hypothetical protein